MYDLEPFYDDDDRETGTRAPRGALCYGAGGGGWWLGDIDLTEVLARADGHNVPILVALGGRVHEVPVQCTCDVCGCPLDDVGVCPRCQLRTALMAGQQRAQQEQERLLLGLDLDLELEREIERIIGSSWQG
jgi:hypothetical protein